MGCPCRRSNRVGATLPNGLTLTGFKVTFPPELNREPETFLTKIEAERVRRTAGGGTITQETK